MSAVREAIKAVLTRWAETSAEPAVQRHGGLDPLGADSAGFLADLVNAVERVPVKVTIRELDMDPENILTVTDPALVTYLAGQLRVANQGRFPVHFAVDRGAIKVKAGNQSWSMGVATSEYEG